MTNLFQKKVNLPVRVVLEKDNKRWAVYTFPKTVGEILEENAISLNHFETTIPATSSVIDKNDEVIKIVPQRYFKIIDKDQTKIILTPYSDLYKIVQEAGINIYPEDRVELVTNPLLEADFTMPTILIQRALPIKIYVDGKIIEARTWQKDVASVLEENHIALGPADKTNPSLKTSLFEGMEIKVTRVKEVMLEENQKIPYEVQESIDFSLPLGEKRIVQRGEEGSKFQVILARYENGKVVSRKVISEKIIKNSKPQIIKIGAQRGIASWYDSIKGLKAAHPTLPFGTKIKVINPQNGRSVIVTVADRGPFVKGRIVDLSKEAFAQLEYPGKGLIYNAILVVLN